MVDWHLLPNEKPIHEAKISRRIPYFFKYYLIMLILSGSGIGLLFSSFQIPYKIFISLGLILIAIIIDIFFIEINRNKERILITTDRVLVRKSGGGIVEELEKGRIEMEQMDLNKIVNISVRQKGIIQRLLKIGDIVIRVPGGDHTVNNLASPYKIERAIYQIIEKEKEIGKIKG